jgi:hypothetical protein
MNSKKTLIVLSAAAVLGMLGASAALASNEHDDSASGPQAQRDWVEWQRSLGRTVPGYGYVPGENGRSAYGYVVPHAPVHKHIKR